MMFMLVPTVIIGMRMAPGATWLVGWMQNIVLGHGFPQVVSFTGPRILQFAKQKIVRMIPNTFNYLII